MEAKGWHDARKGSQVKKREWEAESGKEMDSPLRSPERTQRSQYLDYRLAASRTVGE